MGLATTLSRRSAPAATNKPTAWDPSANEPTLPYPHIARLSRAFLFRPQTINSRCPVAIVSDGLSLTTTQHPEAGGVECNV